MGGPRRANGWARELKVGACSGVVGFRKDM